jgi:DNA uptake protein ComE-like DNA-binding protein
MPTSAERTALTFLAGVLVVGASVRVARAVQGGEKPPPAAAAALQQQQRAVDSARLIRRTLPPVLPAKRVKIVKPKPPPVRFPVDVDRADSTQLDALPGVGPAFAQRILAIRHAGGAFGSLAEFGDRVPGVGPAMLARLDSLVTFSGLPRGRSP